MTAGADDWETSVQNPLLIIALCALYLWISTLSVLWLFSLV